MELVRRPERFVSGLVLAISGVEEEQPEWSEVLVRFGIGPSCWTYLGGVGLICGAGPIGLGLPQRGLGETGKSPITTVKHHRVIVFVLLCFTLCNLHSLY